MRFCVALKIIGVFCPGFGWYEDGFKAIAMSFSEGLKRILLMLLSGNVEFSVDCP